MNVLITGSTRGFGRSLAVAFVKGGHAVVLHGRSEARLAETNAELQTFNSRGVLAQVLGDVRDPETHKRIAAVAAQEQVDCLVNNAGVYEGTVEAIIQTNLLAPIQIISAIYHHFRCLGHGQIININSLAAKGFNDQEAVYAASKWGLHGFSGSFKYAARRDNVGVLDVYPGAMRTDMMDECSGKEQMIDPDEAAQLIVAAVSVEPASLRVTELEIGRR